MKTHPSQPTYRRHPSPQWKVRCVRGTYSRTRSRRRNGGPAPRVVKGKSV